MQVWKDQGVEFCEFPYVLSVSSCAYTVNKSTKEQVWTLPLSILSAQTNALRVCWG